jgi:FKBP-type peptidyl-prolyl cis-trans isomerase 2
LHFTCRLKNGELAISTLEPVNRGDEPKSAIFLARTTYEPIRVRAGGMPPRPDGKMRGFEEEVVEQLSRAAVGMREGESRDVELKAELPAGAKAAPAVLQMAKVRVRPKEYRMKRGDYQIRTGRIPEAGQAFSVDPLFPGRVVSVTDEEVLIVYAAEPGSVVSTPFGKAAIREDGPNYLVEIDAKRGDLVRSGAMIGRIVNVDEKSISVDYGHPFGHEPLMCRIKVETVTKEAK